ncbi:hypothetical protein [Nitrososphaera sp.]|uniref:hypothetical protein n=1 Tax=Nitrososphaera sp. TaxID=1971748 RepID=UPI002ED8D6DC
MSLALKLFITGMWAMLLAIAAFLVLVVAPVEGMRGEIPRIFVSLIQAVIAIAAVVLFVFALSRLKRAYVNRKLPSN